MKTKACNKCGDEKPLDDFNKNRATTDGRDRTCRTCKSKISKAWRSKRKGDATPQAEAVPVVGMLAHDARKGASASLAILHIEHGIRIGPLVTSSTGLTQMPYYVDLTFAQLDELLAWRAGSKEAA